MEALKDLKTTIPGLIIIIIAGAAMLMGKVEFASWASFASGLVGGGFLAANTQKNL